MRRAVPDPNSFIFRFGLNIEPMKLTIANRMVLTKLGKWINTYGYLFYKVNEGAEHFVACSRCTKCDRSEHYEFRTGQKQSHGVCIAALVWSRSAR